MKQHTRLAALQVAGAIVLVPVVGHAQTATPLRIAVSAGEAIAQPYFADQAGYLSRAGFAADVMMLSNGGAVSAAVVSGAADVGITNVASLAAAHSHGVPMQLIAPSTIVSSSLPPATVLSVMKGSPLHAPRDFAGKILGLVALGDLQQAAVMTWLEKGGVDPKSVHFVEIANAEQLIALRSNRVDAALLVEPWLSGAQDEVRAIVAPYDSLGKQLMTHGLIANAAWLGANRPAARRLADAMVATARWANANPQATAPMLATFTKIPLDVVLKMHRLHYGDRLDPAQIQPIIDAAVRYGFLARGFPATDVIASL
jgi:NitT/TauT family transport system substrate-binding protein